MRILLPLILAGVIGCQGGSVETGLGSSRAALDPATTCDSSQHESSGLDRIYQFDRDCALDYFRAAGCDFTLDPDGDGKVISSSTIEDMHNDAANCKRGLACSGCSDDDTIATAEDCPTLARFSYFSRSAWRDLEAQCPPRDPAAGCSIDGVAFNEAEAACAIQFFTRMSCAECQALFDSRVCEDAINDSGLCMAGSTCTGCTDGDARSDGVDCGEIAGYSYLGAAAAQKLLDHVRAHPCGGCEPDCGGKVCGDDGCGGSCGACSGTELCDGAGQCSSPGCTIEGVTFQATEMDCALQFFAGMDCQSCTALLDSRSCEDAIDDPAACQVGTTCTGCGDGDSRDDGVTCAEIEAYAYLGPSAAAKLLDYVRADTSCTEQSLVIEGVSLSAAQVTGIIEIANTASHETLDTVVGLDGRAATGLVNDRPFPTIEAVAAVAYVGTTALTRLREYADAQAAASELVELTLTALAADLKAKGTESPYFGRRVSVARAIITSEPDSPVTGSRRFFLADPIAGNQHQLQVYVAPSASLDTAFTGRFDEVSVIGRVGQYASRFQLQLDDGSVHSLGESRGGLGYADYETIQAAYRSTAAHPEGSVRLVATFGYTYMVPLPVFLDHPMWRNTPPAAPNQSGNLQDPNWNIAAQQALNAWRAAGQPGPEVGVISDLDKTVIPPGSPTGTDPLLGPPYPGVARLYQELELAIAGDVYYVTAREPTQIADIPAWLATHGVPAGPIEPGVSGMPWVARPEKVSDIGAIFDAHPDQRFVLMGDSSHVDPEVQQDLRNLYPGRIAAGLIHRVNNMNPDRAVGLHPFDTHAEAAAILFGLGRIDEAAARRAMQAAKAEGLAITDAEIDALIEARRP